MGSKVGTDDGDTTSVGLNDTLTRRPDLKRGTRHSRTFIRGFVKTPNGLPLGFPIQVDSANRCYRNVSQSLSSCRHFRQEFFNKIGLFCEDMKNHQTLPWPLLLQIHVLGKRGQRQQKSHFIVSLQKRHRDPNRLPPGNISEGPTQ